MTLETKRRLLLIIPFLIIGSIFISVIMLGWYFIAFLLAAFAFLVAAVGQLIAALVPIIIVMLIIGALLSIFDNIKPRFTLNIITVEEKDNFPKFYRVGNPKYRDVEIDIVYLEDGTNSTMIMRHVKEASSLQGIHYKQFATFQKEATSKDYNHLVQTAINWFNVNLK